MSAMTEAASSRVLEEKLHRLKLQQLKLQQLLPWKLSWNLSLKPQSKHPRVRSQPNRLTTPKSQVFEKRITTLC